MERSNYLETQRDRIELECVDELKRILFDNPADLSQVRAVVVGHQVQLQFRRRLRVAQPQELQPLLVPMPRQALVNQLAAGHLQRGEQSK
jgi:hypothetical protein